MAKSSDIPNFGVLNGLKVFSTGSVIAQPWAATLMAECGANVIQAESSLATDTIRMIKYAWQQEHRNERDIALNIPTPEGKEIFLKLCKWADIWMESSKGGTYADWGLTDDVVWKENPRLVIVHVCGYGQTGEPSYVRRASYDAIGQAFGGYMSINGMPEPNPPLRANPYTCDYITALFACWSALAAYINAQKTGKGESIDIAQYEVMARMQLHYPPTYFFEGVQLPRLGNDDPMIVGYTAYQCKDGNWCFIGAGGAGVMKRLLPVLGLDKDPEIPQGVPGFFKGMPGAEKFEKTLKNFFASHTAEEADRIMNENQIPCSVCMTYEMMNRNPHYKAREVFTEWDDPETGRYKGANILPKFKNFPGKIWRGSPTYGMDNDDILEEIGYTKDQIKDLYDKKIIVKKDKTLPPTGPIKY